MVRVSLKNTFLELHEDEESPLPAAPGGSPCTPARARPGRSRSLEGSPPSRRPHSCEASPTRGRAGAGPNGVEPEEEEEEACRLELELQIATLNRLLGSPFSSRLLEQMPPPRGAGDGLQCGFSPFFPEQQEAPQRLPPGAAARLRRGGPDLFEGKEEPHAWASASRSWSSDASPVDGRSEHGSSCSANASTAPPKEPTEQLASLQKVKDYKHKKVPKTHDLKGEFLNSSEGQPPTTLMLRNIPNRLSQSDLIAELVDLGFSGTFDFLYVPLDRGGQRHRHGSSSKNQISNVGYAFVNFVDAGWADRCAQVFQDRCFPGSSRTTRVSPAHVQGLAANLAHYERTAVNNAKLQECRPVVMPNISHRFGCLPPAPR